VVADASLKETPATLVMEKGEIVEFPEQPAVYAVYNKDDQIQYIGLTRKVCLMPPACMLCKPNCTATQHIATVMAFQRLYMQFAGLQQLLSTTATRQAVGPAVISMQQRPIAY
jgi:hypothetical protein